MKVVEAKVVNGKLYLLVEKNSGNLIALETTICDFDVMVGMTKELLQSSMNEEQITANVKGSAYLQVTNAQIVPQEWVDRMRLASGQPFGQIEEKKYLPSK